MFEVGKLLLLIGKPIFIFIYSTVYITSLTLKGVRKIKIPKNYLVRSTIGIFIFALLAIRPLFPLPSVSELRTRKVSVSTKIYDKNSVELFSIYEDENRNLIKISQVPEHVSLATVAAEDGGFYAHRGFSLRGITRGLYKSLVQRRIVGGSTITQQLVKNTLLSSERTVSRKLREIILAVLVEREFGKDEILEMYLNEVAYGGTAYGISAAAGHYFGKNVEELSVAEGAFLAGLPKSPTALSPFSGNVQMALKRKDKVLELMRENNFIGDEVYNSARDEELSFSQNRIEILAPHFVFYIRDKLSQEYGEERTANGGLRVLTTLEYEIQKLVEQVLSEELAKIQNLNVGNGAVVVMHPATGEILAMVGSRDFFDQENDGQVNVVNSLRPPGSAIKVVNYAYALSHGMTPASLIDDIPTSFDVPGQPIYEPKNYDGRYRGRISLRSALAESRNVPAVRVLSSYGVGNMIEMGRAMGIDDWKEESKYGLSLTLGGGNTKLIDLAQVYVTIANGGRRVEPHGVAQIKNYKNETVYLSDCLGGFSAIDTCQGVQAIDPRVAYQIVDILRDNNARSPSFGSRSNLVIPGHSEIAVKTGTSNDLRDNVTVGFNQDYLVAVWVGNNDNSPMSRVASGVTGASAIWNRIMGALVANQKPREWSVPQGLVHRDTCGGRREWFLEENIPKIDCNFKQFASN